MNAGVRLVSAVHQISVAAEITIAAGPAEKSDANALTNLPVPYCRTHRIDPPDHFMTGNAWPLHGKLTLDGCGIGVAHATSLDAEPHLVGSRLAQGHAHFLQTAGTHHLYCSICIVHV